MSFIIRSNVNVETIENGTETIVKSTKMAPARLKTPPKRSKTAPKQSKTAPKRSKAPPKRWKIAPKRSKCWFKGLQVSDQFSDRSIEATQNVDLVQLWRDILHLMKCPRLTPYFKRSPSTTSSPIKTGSEISHWEELHHGVGLITLGSPCLRYLLRRWC